QELCGGVVDAVRSDSAEFLPLERALASQQSGLILDTIGEGICITDGAGQILWSNKRIRQWSPAVRERIQKVCHEAWQMFTTQTTPPAQQMVGGANIMVGAVGGSGDAALANKAHAGRSRKFSFSLEESQYFKMFCSPW